MDRNKLRQLLQEVKDGELDIPAALERLKSFPYDDLGFAKIDTHRHLRRGFPEVIFCQGKTPSQVVDIFQTLRRNEHLVMATRATADVFDAIRMKHPGARYNESARIVLSAEPPTARTEKRVVVVSAGTSDMPIAEEAAVTAECMGCPADRIYDVGVAGIHRLLDNREKLAAGNVIIAVAGMEGALASVVGGMVERPVIAVPTSVGYGASFEGLAALLAMLNSCAPGVAVMNIDNGFGAGYFASIINLGE
ncbi:MAG: nickel pincer cofactor biosynthesis protein LarB [Candidatus Zixiibacteriota bacterium]